MDVNSSYAPPVAPRPTVQGSRESNPQAVKRDSADPVLPTFKDPPPRFPYPEDDRGRNLDLEV